MSKFLMVAVEEESILPDLRAVEGKTTKHCPYCGKSRRRHYDVTGPLLRSQVDHFLKEIKPRVSAKPIWKKLYLAWLVSPPDPPKEGEYYEIRIYATCTNRKCPSPGKVRIPEREGFRQFGLIEKPKLFLRSILSLGVDLITPF